VRGAALEFMTYEMSAWRRGVHKEEAVERRRPIGKNDGIWAWPSLTCFGSCLISDLIGYVTVWR
jgi:hypothetical protein